MFTTVQRSEVVVFTVSEAQLQLPFIHPSMVPIGLPDCAIWSEAKVQSQITAVDELRPAPNAAKTGHMEWHGEG